jgi:hypothetical protein
VNTRDIFILCDPLKPLYAAVLRGLRVCEKVSPAWLFQLSPACETTLF